MITISQSKVKVALSLFFTVTVFSTFLAQAQTKPLQRQQNITADYHDLTIGELLQKLSETTHLHFIYSSNYLHAQGLISLSLHEQSVEEALGLLGKKVNLNFKRQGDYIIVTPGNAPSLKIPNHKFIARKTDVIAPETSGNSTNHFYKNAYRSDQVDGSVFLKDYRLHQIRIDSLGLRKYFTTSVVSGTQPGK